MAIIFCKNRRPGNFRLISFVQFDWLTLILAVVYLKLGKFQYLLNCWLIGFVPFCYQQMNLRSSCFHKRLFVCFVLANARSCFVYRFFAALSIIVL